MSFVKTSLLLVFLAFGHLKAERIVIAGSDTPGAKMVPQLKEGWLKEGNSADFEIAAEGSSQAFTTLLAGTADIGMASRKVKETELAMFRKRGLELKEHIAAWDMIALVVHEKNPVKSLTLKQVEGIFTGEITDWKELGGEPGRISAYTRNTASGTYKSFQKLAMSGRDYGKRSQKMGGSEQPASEVAGNINGIAYVGLAYVRKEGVSAVKINGGFPDPAKKAKYPLSRKLYYYTAGEPTGEVKKFLDWAIHSRKAKEIVEKVGFIPVD